MDENQLKPHESLMQLYAVVGVENLHHVFQHGLPCTSRPDASSEERSPRYFYSDWELALAMAKVAIQPGGRWENKLVAIVGIAVTPEIINAQVDARTAKLPIDFKKTNGLGDEVTTHLVLLAQDVPADALDASVEILRPGV